jgi:hypothetical protein
MMDEKKAKRAHLEDGVGLDGSEAGKGNSKKRRELHGEYWYWNVLKLVVG